MGQKVNPIGFRLGITRNWDSRWFAKREYSELLHEDLSIRELIKERFQHAGIGKIEVERAANRTRLVIYAARPGIIIGKKGQEIEQLRNHLQRMTGKEIMVTIEEVRRPDLSAQLVSENVAAQLLRRISFRRAMKRAVLSSIKAGAQGVKLSCAGRLAGAEIARTEWYRQGRVPLHTLRADIDYGFAEARTKYGVIGVKAWLFLGEIFEKKLKSGV